MHTQRIVLAVAMMATIATIQAQAADRRVPSQYSTVAAALAAAGPGDRVVLAPGVYEEFDLDLPAGVTLLGISSTPASVVIDAGRRGRVLRAENLDQPAAIVGLTLTGGRAQGSTPYDTSGGGLLVSKAQVRLEDVILVGNLADGSGGGLRASHAAVVMVRCRVRGNTAGKGGGAMDLSYDSSLSALKCEFTDNQAAWGGALSVRTGSTTAIFESSLVRNRAVGDPGLGGALACDRDSAPSFKRCVVADNEARYGGAVAAADGAEPALRYSTVDRNSSTEQGAGFYCRGTSLELDHTIVSFHPQTAFVCLDDARPNLSACNVYGNVGGDWVGELVGQIGNNGNFSADPLFCDIDDRHLHDDSPCAPKQSGTGLVGALGVGCDTRTDVPSALESVELTAQPNPFNPMTEIVYTLPESAHARVSVYDIRGRRLVVLVDESRPSGESRVRWEARDDSGRSLASGTYLLVLETGGLRLTSKLMLVR